MYIVEIQNGNERTEIHGQIEKLTSGKVTQGINTIDSFVFTILPSNVGFSKIRDFTTLVSVYNSKTLEYEFQGRVLYTAVEMSDSGMISKQVTCESMFGYLCDSVQTYVVEKNWTVRGLLEHILNTHNALVEPEKRFFVRNIGVEDKNDNLYVGIQRENTWETIKKKLIEVLGGEITFKVTSDGIFLDYVPMIGEEKETEIELSRNMKSIERECNPSDLVTRLIPLGAKKGDTEDRYDIRSVNNGVEYIDDTNSLSKYGIHVGVVEWDDVKEPSILKTKAVAWIAQNNKALVRYSITALDLFLIGLAYDSFRIGNTHPLKNSLIGVNDKGRITKRSVDVCDETKNSFEIGDNFKSASEIQRDQMTAEGNLKNEIAKLPSTYASKNELDSFATKGEVSNLIEKVESEMPKKTSQLVNDSGYATETFVKNEIAKAELDGEESDIDMSGFATKDDIKEVENKIPDTSDLATKEEVEEVENKIPDTSNLATKEEVEKVEEKIPDTSNLATKEDVSNVENKIPDTSHLVTREELEEVEDKIPDTSEFVTEETVKELINDAIIESGQGSGSKVNHSSVVYNGRDGEERIGYFTIDTNFLANNGWLYIDDVSVSAMVASEDGWGGARFPLTITAANEIFEITIVTKYFSTLIPDRGSIIYYDDPHVRIWTPFEGERHSNVIINSDAPYVEEIKQILIKAR